MKLKTKKLAAKLFEGLTVRKLVCVVIGAAICTFGIHNIHQRVDITEGGIIGLMLLAEHWLGVSPAYITPVLDAACYLLAFKYLGGMFIKLSLISTLCVSGWYKVWEQLPYLFPDLTEMPLVGALVGGAFVGVGFGLIIRQGGSGGGDDALALTISHLFRWRLSVAYMFTDFVVLALSLTYIPVLKIVYSLITVTISSNLIDIIKSFHLPKARTRLNEEKLRGDKHNNEKNGIEQGEQ